MHAVRSPVSWLIWLWVLSQCAEILFNHFTTFNIPEFNEFRDLLIISMFIWIGVRVINQVEHQVLQNPKRDATTVSAVAKVARLFLITIGAMAVMQNLGLSLSGLLTFGGVGGLIIGLAAKDLLSNFFGGLMIYFDRPFKVGDWIRSPDRQIEGTVERIGWRMTVIRTFDQRPLYVPNSVFSSIVVENPSRMFNRRIKETIGLRYEDADKMAVIVTEVKHMLETHPEIDTHRTLMVNFDTFGASSLNFFIYTFTKTTVWARYHEVKQDVMLKIVDIVQKHGADFAFPTQTLYMEAGEGWPQGIPSELRQHEG